MVTLKFVVLTVVVVFVSGDIERGEHGRPDVKHVHKHEHYPDGEHDTSYDHDAVLGSHKLEEEFSQLSPEVAKERLGKLVQKMDVNGDGVVSKAELTDWIAVSFKNLDAEEADARFKEYDTSGDGKVSWDDYLDKVYGMGDVEIKAMERTPETEDFLRMRDDDEKKFNAADVNKDGVLDEKEFVAFEYPYDFQHMHDVELDRSLGALDKNNDGKLSFEEFLEEDVSEEEKIVQDEQFKNFDKNGDRELDREEARPWALPDNDYAAMEEAEHLIGQTDKDSDGALTAEEIVENHELWVGSQATNYGRHLQDEL